MPITCLQINICFDSIPVSRKRFNEVIHVVHFKQNEFFLSIKTYMCVSQLLAFLVFPFIKIYEKSLTKMINTKRVNYFLILDASVFKQLKAFRKIQV